MELYFMMSLLFGFGGAIITLIAVSIHRSIVTKQSKATKHTQATITEVIDTGHRSAPRYIYEFSANDSLWRAEASGKSHLREGDAVTIYYDPNCPENIYIPQTRPNVALIVLHIIGIGWLFASMMLFVFWKMGIK